MDDLSTRKRDILRRVVEEYIATGEPVGSKTLVDSSGLGVSASTVRGELAELESLGLLTHPHTSAGRIPTDSGYRFYAGEVLERQAPRPERFPLDLTSMRSEVEAALQSTTEMLGQVTRLLALVSAPGHETATVRHVEVLLLQPSVLMVVTITSAGGVAQEARHVRSARRPGPGGVGERVPERAPDRCRPRDASGAEAVRGPGPLARGARLSRRAEAGVRRARHARGAVALRRRRRLAARRRAGGRARGLPAAPLRAREARGRPRADERRVRRATAVHPSRARPPRAARRRARRRHLRTADPHPRHDRRCSGRSGWTTRRRCARSGPPRSSSRDSSSRRTRRTDRPGTLARMATAERDYYELLGVAAGRERRRDQEGVPQARARAAPGRLQGAGRAGALPGRRRGVRGALQDRDARSSTIATGTRGCAAAATRRRTSTSRT